MRTQTVKYALGQWTWAAGQPFAQKLRDLPDSIDGRIAHLQGFELSVAAQSTGNSNMPTVVGMNNAIFDRVELFDGRSSRFVASGGAGMHLKNFERYENGKPLSGEGYIVAGTPTDPKYFSRHLSVAPLRAAKPTDFAIPSALLKNGELRLTGGALATWASDASALSATVTITAIITLLDEIRIPPFVERQIYGWAGKDDRLTGESRVMHAALVATDFSAFAAGSFGGITLETGSAMLLNNVNAAALSRAYQDEMEGGQFSTVQGEPLNATYDKNQRDVSYASASAVVAPAADLQPVLYCPAGTQISKVVARVNSAMRLYWTGSRSGNNNLMVTRLLPQSPETIARMASECQKVLGVSGALKLKTISKREYVGPDAAFMPYAVKI